MTAPTHPLAWIQTLSSALKWCEEIPLWGYSPTFDTALWGEKIQPFLGLSHFSIQPHKTAILKPEQFLSNLGTNPVSTPFILPPLPEGVHLLVSHEDVSALTSVVLSPKGASKGFSSPGFTEGFYRYLLLQLLHFISGEEEAVKPWKNLSLKIGTPAPLPVEESLVMDFLVKLPHQELLFRLICPTSFQNAFREHFRTPILEIPEDRARDIPLSLSCEVGSTTLSIHEWQALKSGDLLLLDRCNYDLKTHKGTGSLVLENVPLFRVRFKDAQIKITDYASYYEELMEEPSNNPPEENNENPIVVETQSTEEIISQKEIPLTLVVEVARLKFDLAKLLKLQPGNLLELSVRPEQGVCLMANGKKVASGELVKLGDSLGVKILKLGSA